MFKALLLTQPVPRETRAECVELDEASLPAGAVRVAVSHSTLNYKDALAITGRSPVVRQFPMVPGIDFAGSVTQSDHPKWKAGDRVLLNGFGVGENHWGGLSQMARVKGDWLVALPDTLSERDAMAVGTAGYTAMLCVMALQKHWAEAGVRPGSGEVLVTGAGGGVMALGQQLMSAGIGMGQITALSKEVFAYGQEKAGEDTMGAIVGAIGEAVERDPMHGDRIRFTVTRPDPTTADALEIWSAVSAATWAVVR